MDDKQLREYRLRLIERLAAQPAELGALIAALPEPEWHQRRAEDGATLHQLAVHMRDAEAMAFWPRFRLILAEDYPHLDAFPYHRWSVEQVYRADESLAEVLATFTRTRAEAVATMRTLTPDDWSRTGFHPPSGPRTLQWWAERIYNHARSHLEQIAQIVGQTGTYELWF